MGTPFLALSPVLMPGLISGAVAAIVLLGRRRISWRW